MADHWKLLAGATAGVISGATLAALISRNQKANSETPRRWVKVGTVSELLIYPIKSCKGVNVDEAFATQIGLKASDHLRDRIFMVVDERYVFQTQRTIPKMVLIHPTVNGDTLSLSAPGMETIEIEIPQDNNNSIKKSCRIFDDFVAESLDCGDKAGTWLDSFLGKSGFRLVYHALENTQRSLNALQKKFPTFEPKDKGSFQDQTSYMLIAEGSIDALNSNLQTTKVSHRNFRPSIMIKGIQEPFAEEVWGYVKIGDNGPVLKSAKPCTRCKLTTVDPDTGEFIKSGEPLSKLVKMPRSTGNEIVDALIKNQGVLGLQLGLHAGAESPVKVGDPVYVAVL